MPGINTLDKSIKKLYCQADDSQLLIIDIQSKLTSVMPDKVIQRLVYNTGNLAQAAGLLSIPVHVSQQYPKGLGTLIPEIAELLPAGYQQYDKTCFSCAGVNNLMQEISHNKRNQIIIAGIEAHICVLQTALDLIEAGYQVYIVNDAVSSRQRDNYENALGRLQMAGAIISNSESVIFEWLSDATHPQFRKISAMIK